MRKALDLNLTVAAAFARYALVPDGLGYKVPSRASVDVTLNLLKSSAESRCTDYGW